MPKRATTPETDADLAASAARKVVDTHRALADFLRPGQTLAEIDRFIAGRLAQMHCKSCFLGYKIGGLPPFPSHACLSLNECVVHGTAAAHPDPLVEGDLLKIDIGVNFRGWIGDAAWTYAIGEPDTTIRALMDCGKASLRRGIPELRPGQTYTAWARTVHTYVEETCGFHLVRGLGGHGYGKHTLHKPPFISNTIPDKASEWPDGSRLCAPGTYVAVEPMLAVSTGRITQEPGTWPICTLDGSMSVHYEHDVLITADGPEVLTEGLDDLPDVIS